MKRVGYACLLTIILAACAQVAVAQLANSCWPKFRKDYANTGQGLYGGTGSDLSWTYTAGGAIQSAPVVGVDGTTYFACNDGRLYAIAGSGARLWDFFCNCQGTSSPAIASDGTVYIASVDKYVYAIRPDGTQKWKRGLTSRVESSISIGADGTLYYGCSSGALVATKPDGNQKWTYTTGGSISSSPAIGPDGTIYFGSMDGGVYALYSTGTQAGKLKWKFTSAGSGGFAASPTLAPDGTVYIGSTGGYFYAIGTTGTQKWRATAGGDVRSSAALSPGGAIYYGCRDRKLHALSSTGAQLWTFTTGHYVDSSPAVGIDGGIYFGSLDGRLYALNPDGTERWNYNTGSAVYSSPSIGPAGALFVGAENGTLYCFAADSTPPINTTTADDGAYTSILDRLRGSWSAADPESGIFSYEYCIGTEPGLANVAPWLNVGSATQHTRTGLALADKQVYYITVRAINGAGLAGPEVSSDGIIADATPPTAPVVIDDGKFTANASTLHSSWSASDPESGIVGYQYSIGTSAGGTTIVGWTDVGLATEVTRTGLTLQSGFTYYVNVRALNGGGVYGPVGSSNGITVDTSAPPAPVVTDAGPYFSDPAAIAVSWSASDYESGISKFEYSVGTAAGGTNVKGWTDAGTGLQASITGLSLTNGGTYFVNVRATNGAGLVSPVGSSDGITLDTTPPTTPTVTDDGAFTASTTELRASWSSSDPQSGITLYRYAIGTTPGGAEIVPWTSIGTTTAVTHSGLALTHNRAYYFSVIAVNGASASSQVGTSDGITVDATAPTTPVVVDDGQFTGDSTRLHATWSASDPESGISRYEYAAGIVPGGTDVVAWTNVGTSTSVTRTGLALQDGMKYYISVRAYNAVNTASAVGTSDGITVDVATPPAPAVTDDGGFTSSPNSLHFRWGAVTSPSGIASYEYSIGTSAGGTSVRGWTNVGLALETTATGLALQSGVTYFANVRAVNSLGKAGAAGSSDGITVDLTGPTTPTVTDGGAWTASASQLAASWSASDPESGIAEYRYAVGTTPGGANVLGWTSAGTQTSATIEPLSLADGGTYYISVKAANGAGIEGPSGTSDGIRVDLTPPTTPTVTDDGAFTIDSTRLHAVWSASDPQSGIAKYEYAVGTSAGAADVVDWTSAGNATEATITGLSLGSGIRYFISVRATNGAESVSQVGSSDGIYVESTPPTTPMVTDEGDYTRSTTTLSASWTAEDPETGVAAYSYAIGTAPGLDNVVPWTNAGTTTSVTRSDLALDHGETYYVSVKATNGIGLVSEVGFSDGITVDTTEPGMPVVDDEGGYTSSLDSIRVTLECDDPESGIAFYECAVGTTVGGTDILGWTNAGMGPEVTITGLALVHGKTYFVSARATNGAGITGEPGVSNGITVDTTPPTGLAVTDDGDFSGSANSLRGRWFASDPESGIARYKYCIGTTPGLDDVAGWLDVGSATEHVREGLSLTSGQIYYVTVVAVNSAGSESAPVSSDGIRLDLTPPTTPAVTDSGQYWGYRNSIYASWSADDPESGVVEYQMSVGTAPGATNVASWISVGAATSHTRGGLSLADGITYYVNIKARNGAGTWSAIGSSDGVLIDSTPPTTPVVIDDGDTTAVLDRLHAIWHSEDPESGIAEYLYCIGTSPGATDVVPWTSAGTEEEVTVTELSLDPVLRYYFSVKARSNSGAWSAVSASDGIGFSSGAAIWWKFRNDSANMGRGLFTATTVNDLAWVIPTQGYVESSPAIAADGTTYIGSGDGKLYAITQNGTLRWTYDTGSPIDSSPAVAPDGAVVFGCNGGRLHCLNPAGELLWEYQTGDAVRSSPLIDEGLVYIGSYDGKLHAVDLESGFREWTFPTGGAIKASPAVDKDGVVYIASEDACIYAVNADGTQKWKFRTGSAVDASPAVGADGTIYIGSGDGCLYAIRPDGTEKWRFVTGTLADSSAAIGPDGSIYFGAGFDGGSGRLYALKPDKTVIWQVNLPGGGVVSSPAIDPSGTIYVGSCDRRMYAFRPDGAMLWSYQTQSSVVSSPALGADSSVVFGSYDGNIYCLRDVTSKDLTPPTTPVVIVPGPTLPAGKPLAVSWSAEDPDSMVAEYTYAVGTGPMEPENANVVGWTSAGIETSVLLDYIDLQPGETYYVSVKARNPSQRWSGIGVSEGVMVTESAAVESIGEIRSLPEGFKAMLSGKVVTAVFDDCFFIEEPDRCAGIRCVHPDAPLQVGDRVEISGTVKMVNGRRALVSVDGHVIDHGDPLRPLGMPGRAMRAVGLDPVGLYVTVWGVVAAEGPGYVVVDDGSGLQSTRGSSGVEVHCTGNPASVGDRVTVTGVLCMEMVDDQPAMVVRVAPADGVTLLPQ